MSHNAPEDILETVLAERGAASSSSSQDRRPAVPAARKAPGKRRKPAHAKKLKRWKRVLRWCLGVLTGLIFALLAAFFGMLYIPLFQEARDWYVLMTSQTSNPWLATAFLPDATVQAILEANRVEAPQGSTDPDLVKPVIPLPKPEPPASGESVPPEPEPLPAFGASDAYPGTVVFEEEGVQVLEIPWEGTTARLIQVADPSRVFLGVTDQLGTRGQFLPDMCRSNNALCGINAGGFDDPGGHGKGGVPTGIVVKDFRIVYTDGEETHNVVGFNRDNVLVLGQLTDQQILDQGIRDAMSWSPFLIVNGEKAQMRGQAGGYNPRSAIGQRADGLVLLLVADGRQAGMPGANHRLMMDILYEYGAYNAASLDGGTSSTVVLEGEIINSVCNPTIARNGRLLPDAWLVREKEPAAE
jgi:exopolysaccharide biosynthesis protein